MEKKKDLYKEEIEHLQQSYLKERDEPTRLDKGNENLNIAVEHLKKDYNKLVSETVTVDASFATE